jgi:hypothetical protein
VGVGEAISKSFNEMTKKIKIRQKVIKCPQTPENNPKNPYFEI